MKIRTKKFLSGILALLLVMSTVIVGMPMTVFAAEAEATNEAKIGDIEYATLKEAIQAVQGTPTTIILLKDAKIANTMVGHQKVQNITLDLGGHTLTSTGIALTAYRKGTTLRVQNGTVLGNSSSGTLRATYGGELILGDNLTVQGAGGGATLVYVDNGSAKIESETGVTFVGGKVDFKVSDNANNKLNVAANIGRTYFGSFAAAFAAAEDGDTITLQKPVVVAKGETLNLNKKVTITYTSSTKAHEAMITNNGTLIVDGAEITYTYNGVGDPNFGWGSYTIYNNGDLTVNSGKVEFIGSQAFATHCSLAIFQYAGSTAINGGNIINNAYRSVRLWKGNMTINGGSFEGQVWVHCVDDSAKLTIKGGSFAPAKNGGDGSSVFVNNSGKKAELSVTGGNFATKIGANDVAALKGSITGGIFTEAAKNGTNATLLGENATFEKNDNGTYGVVAVPAVNNVAQIGTKGYATLAEALAAAKDGDIITFLADITENVTINKAITIDGAGKTYIGAMILEADTTIKNVNFDGKGYNGYAVNTRGAEYVTIENCTAKGYGYGFLQTPSGNNLITVKNVTISDMNYGIKIDYSNAVELENVTITGCLFGVMDSNYGEKTITFKNCDIEAQYPLALWDRKADIVSIFAFEGDNTLTAPAGEPSVIVYSGNTSLYAIVLKENAALTATANLNVSAIDGYEVKYENGIYTSVEKLNAIAKIGEQGYATLADALAAAQDGDIITLLADLDMSDILVINKAITLDGNGKTLTSTAGRAINVSGANGVTIKNLTIDCSGERAINIIQSATNVTIENVTATAANYAVNVASSAAGAVVAIKNSTLTGLNVVNVAAAAAKVTVADSKLTCNDQNTAEIYAALTLSPDAVGAEIAASNVTFAINGDSIKAANGAKDGTITINGSEDGVLKAVAYIAYGNNYYTFYTIQAAINAANEGDTITLLAPIVVNAGETLTLDKNVTITYTSNVVGEDMITVRGTLNVVAGKITYTNTDTTGNNVTVSTISAEPGSVVNVSGGIIENKTVYSTGSYAYAIDMLTNGSLGDVTVTISGGKIYSDYMAIRQFNNGTACKNSLTVTGGEIYGAKRAIQIHLKNDAAYLAISGGKIEAGEGGYALCLFPETATQIAVTGGQFIGTVYSGTNGIISGGTYSEELYAGYIKEGFALSENEDGTYGVKVEESIKGSGTATDPYQIGSVKDLIMFRDSVNAGETKYNAPGVYVVLTANIDLAGINWVGIGSATADHGFMGNFDGNGYKIMNLTIIDPALDSDGYAYAGFFGVTEGVDASNQNTIKNLIIENVTISTTGHIVAAAIAYPYYTNVDNITVRGNIAITGGNYTAGVLAYTRRCINASNLTVEGKMGSYITGQQTVGGVISDIQMNGGLTANYFNFKVNRMVITGTKQVGGISGIISGQTLNGASVKMVEIVCADERVGIISGALGGTSTITGVNINGVLVNDSEIGAIIGRTYNNGAIEAKVGDTYYASFVAALEAAKTGDTITLLNNVTLTDKDAVVTGSGVTVLLNVSGKNITLDLNGKTIYLENNSTEMIYAGIFVDKNAALTVKDSVGNGGIRAENVKQLENGMQDIGYMILNYSTTNGAKNLVIEGGNFYANNLEDSIVYSQGNETVVIKGGSFVLDAIGTRSNGHPWIFNAKGQNIQHILVEGGSFNADVLHQYWIFEVEALYNKALKYNAETRMYTMVDAVAYVTERHWSGNWYTQNIGYATIEEAIAACQGVQTKIYYNKEYKSEPEVVVLLKNVEINKTVTIANGQSVIIDLMGLKVVGTFSGKGNQEMFLVKGNLTVKNGYVEMQATVNQSWNAMSTVFDVTAGGVLNIDKATIVNQGGTDMNFCVHLNNWGEVTLNVTDSTLIATYIPVRVFNSGNNMNNVTIKGSSLKGKYCFWVHNYTLADFGTQEKVDAHKQLLNFNFYGDECGNDFEYTNSYDAPVIYGFTNTFYVNANGEVYDADGNRVVDDADDLQDAVNNGGNIVLDGDIVLGEGGLVIP